jgi:O-antigen/teichoic acid export membrane protein
MGLFNAANQWRMAVLFLPNLLSQVALPILSSLHGARAFDRYTRMLRFNLLLVFAMSGAVAIPIVIFAKQIMAAYGPGFREGSSVLIVTSLTVVLSASIGVIGSAISSIGRMWHGFFLNIVWGLAFVILAASLTSRGAYGLALAYLFSYMIHLGTVSWYVLFVLRGMHKVPGPSLQPAPEPLANVPGATA